MAKSKSPPPLSEAEKAVAIRALRHEWSGARRDAEEQAQAAQEHQARAREHQTNADRAALRAVDLARVITSLGGTVEESKPETVKHSADGSQRTMCAVCGEDKPHHTMECRHFGTVEHVEHPDFQTNELRRRGYAKLGIATDATGAPFTADDLPIVRHDERKVPKWDV